MKKLLAIALLTLTACSKYTTAVQRRVVTDNTPGAMKTRPIEKPVVKRFNIGDTVTMILRVPKNKLFTV